MPKPVRGDATRARQVLMNLAGNAIKFSRGRADVRGVVSVHVSVTDELPLRIVLRISDNGIGMSPEVQGRLFTSFTQAEASTTRRFGGTGLGLAISKRLVDLMDGTIEVTSELGRGSTFTVTLPFQASERQPDVVSEGPAVARGSGRPVPLVLHHLPLSMAEACAQGRLILVAEDDSMNQKVILQQLALLGYAGEIAADGVEALRMWRQGTYALLLSDLHMPHMDGYELAREIRGAEPPGEHLPIMALTANALRGEADAARSAGMDGYLTKPVPLATLSAVLGEWILPTPAVPVSPAADVAG